MNETPLTLGAAGQSTSDGAKEATKTYLEQTKLLVTLASAFLFAPAGLVAILKDRTAVGLTTVELLWFVIAEAAFVLSVLAGYVVFGAVAGSQDDGSFNVFRPATRISSLVQIGLYLLGMTIFAWLAYALIGGVGRAQGH